MIGMLHSQTLTLVKQNIIWLSGKKTTDPILKSIAGIKLGMKKYSV